MVVGTQRKSQSWVDHHLSSFSHLLVHVSNYVYTCSVNRTPSKSVISRSETKLAILTDIVFGLKEGIVILPLSSDKLKKKPFLIE
jgi:hypothetical protein